MSPPADVAGLLDDHFDGGLDETRREELVQLLQTPAARSQLVQRARFEALLHRTCARRARPVGRLQRPGWIVASSLAAAALLVLGVAWFLVGSPPEAEGLEIVSGSPAYADGTPMTRIQADATLVAEGREAAVFRLPDGSTSTLSPGSTAVYRTADAGTRGTVELGFGQGSFVVQAQPKPLAVTTVHGRITATSAQFTVDLDEDAQRMDVSVKDGQIEVLSGQVTLAMRPGDRQSFFGLPGVPKRAGTLKAVSDGRLTLSFVFNQPGKQSKQSEFSLAPSASIIIDGKPGSLAAIPLGTKVLFEGDYRKGISTLIAIGPEASARIQAIDHAKRLVSLRLFGADRVLDVPFERFGADELALKRLVRIRLSLDGTRVLTARVLSGHRDGRSRKDDAKRPAKASP